MNPYVNISRWRYVIINFNKTTIMISFQTIVEIEAML